MKGRKQQLKGGAEWDVLYGRAYYCYLSRAGVAKSIKRGMNRRERREAKQELYNHTGLPRLRLTLGGKSREVRLFGLFLLWPDIGSRYSTIPPGWIEPVKGVFFHPSAHRGTGLVAGQQGYF